MQDLLEERRRGLEIITGFGRGRYRDLAQNHPRGRHYFPNRHRDLVATFYVYPSYRDENPGEDNVNIDTRKRKIEDLIDLRK